MNAATPTPLAAFDSDALEFRLGQVPPWGWWAIAVGLAVLWILIAVLRSGHHKKVVRRTSVALAELDHLNREWRDRVIYFAPIVLEFAEKTRTKAAFDRYDLTALFHERIREQATTLQSHIGQQLEAGRIFEGYARLADDIKANSLGTSRARGISRARYERVETLLFARTRLRDASPKATIRCVVTYTSPKGQNHYERDKTWDFEQLRTELDEVQRLQELGKATRFFRQQERNRMTGRLRVQVLRRDGSRCRMCGATPHDGAKLHVDHIVPVAKGGRTVLSNLQTLCQDCNLGKSDAV